MKAKTFAEVSGQPKFDWIEFLKQENISEEDWEKAMYKAAQWTTCACGNQCEVIPRESDGTPEDEILKTLGGDQGFYKAIKNKDADAAFNFLKMIEIRSAFLIEIEKQKTIAAVAEAEELLKSKQEFLKKFQ